MDHKPAEIIRQARQKAEKAIMERCGSEIQRICDAFSYDTGLGVDRVVFNTLPIMTIGEPSPKTHMGWPDLEHERV